MTQSSADRGIYWAKHGALRASAHRFIRKKSGRTDRFIKTSPSQLSVVSQEGKGIRAPIRPSTERVPIAAADVFIPNETPNSSYFELSIRIDDEDLTVRDLSAFLDFIDGIYGRLTKEGFNHMQGVNMGT